jgi:hypothetical protein
MEFDSTWPALKKQPPRAGRDGWNFVPTAMWQVMLEHDGQAQSVHQPEGSHVNTTVICLQAGGFAGGYGCPKTESHTVGDIRTELIANSIPILLIIMIMPFVSGLITGIAIGFVGTSFPLVIPLFQALPAYDSMALAAVAYTFGFMGMMLSPVHLCFLVSKDYYKAGLLKSYRHLALPTLTVMAATLILYLGIISP